MARIWWMNYRKRRQNKARIYVRLIPSRECLCSEFSLAQQKRTKEGLGPVLAGQRGSAHRTDMKLSGFIRQDRGTQGDDGNSTRPLPRSTPQAVRSKNTQVEKKLTKPLFHPKEWNFGSLAVSSSTPWMCVCVHRRDWGSLCCRNLQHRELCKCIRMAGVQYGFRLCSFLFFLNIFTNLISFHKKWKYSERF